MNVVQNGEIKEEYPLGKQGPINRVEYFRNNSYEVLTLDFADGRQGQVSRGNSGGNLLIILLDKEKRAVPDTAEGPQLDYLVTNSGTANFNFQRDVIPLIKNPLGRDLMDAYARHLRHN